MEISEANKKWINLKKKTIKGTKFRDDEFIFCLLCAEDKEVGIDETEICKNLSKGGSFIWNQILEMKAGITKQLGNKRVEFKICDKSIVFGEKGAIGDFGKTSISKKNPEEERNPKVDSTEDKGEDKTSIGKYTFENKSNIFAEGSLYRGIYTALYNKNGEDAKFKSVIDDRVGKMNAHFDRLNINQKKTRIYTPASRKQKVITGVSVDSQGRLGVPQAKEQEIRNFLERATQVPGTLPKKYQGNPKLIAETIIGYKNYIIQVRGSINRDLSRLFRECKAIYFPDGGDIAKSIGYGGFTYNGE